MTAQAANERDPIDWQEALRLRQEEGWTYGDIAEKYRYAYKTVREGLRKRGAKPRRPVGRGRKAKKLRELWRHMHEKCEEPGHSTYHLYGARGIRVCPEWFSFERFYSWSLSSGYRLGLRLARVDRGKEYSPDNCRWITESEKQCRRQGRRPSSTSITAFGERKSQAEWTRGPRCAVTRESLRQRLIRGDSPEAAITAPPDPVRKPGAKKRPKRKPRRQIDWAEAERLYLEEGLSKPEIARRIGASYTGLIYAFNRFGVEREDSPAPTSTPEGMRLHKTWMSIHARCEDPEHHLFPYAGARGAKVCKAWEEFEPFFRWAVESGAAPGLCLVRRDRSRGFSPANCAWVSRTEAALGKRPPSRPPPPRRPLTAFGETKGIVAWSKDSRCPVTQTTIAGRLAKGWPVEEAITHPPQNRGSLDTCFTELRAFGVKQGVTAWTRDRRCKIGLTGLMDRLRREWTPEEAISTHPFKRRPTKN